MTFVDEYLLLHLACLFYLAAILLAYVGQERFPFRFLMIACSLGLVLHTLSLALRWVRIDHGPFINLYEILSSNLWSLMLGLLCFLLLSNRQRAAVRFALPLPALLMAWLLTVSPADSHLPPTYDTPWLYFHVLSGKFFLALLMLAMALAIYEVRAGHRDRRSLTAIESGSYRMLAFAFCFESLMLLFGAIWAQDAWGRFWAWDPLETWAFCTWLAVIFVLHWRLNYPRGTAYAVLVGACFALAFLTFFGVPFISTAPHKGMI